MEKDEKKELSRRDFLAWVAAAAATLALPIASNRAHASTAAMAVRVIDLNSPVVVPDPPPSIILNGDRMPGNGYYVHPSSVSRVPSATPQVSYASPPAQANYQLSQVTYAQPAPAPTYAQPVQVAYTQPTTAYAQPVQTVYAQASYVQPQPVYPTQPPQAANVQPIQAMQMQGGELQRTSVNLENRHMALSARAPVPSGGKVRAVSRNTWSATPANPGKMRPMNGVTRITIHHEGSAKPNDDRNAAQVIETLRLIQSQHRKRMGAGDIGYHFIIDRTGVIWQGRDWAYQGAHTSGANPNNMGVMLLGNFEIQQPTQAQLASLQSLVGSLVRKYGLNPQRDIFGHSDFCNTQCPGKHLKPQVQALRRGLRR